MIVYRELSSIERELGFSAKTLYGVSNSLDRHYRKVTLPKKNGGTRTLSVPDEILKRIQRAIAEKLLSYRPVSRFATAYKPAASIKKNACRHVGKKKLVKLDIFHFFDSILYSTVKDKVFPCEIFSEKLRILLSMLCYYRDALPQGAPTSPFISNIILFDFDERVGAFCHERGITYTRYCDDMIFSGDFDEVEVVAFVEEELRSRGFFLNRNKTAVIPKTKQQKVTGLVVNDGVAVARSYRRTLRQEIYYLEKFGVRAHLERIASPLSPEKYLNSLFGKLSFVLSVTPNDREALALKQKLLALT